MTLTVSEHWTRENIVWLAGLLEGEGSFHVKGSGKIVIQLGMTDEDVVRKSAFLAGCGAVNGPYQSKRYNCKPIWAWKVSKGAHCYALCTAIYPFMGVRRKSQIELLMKAWFERQRCSPAHGVRAHYQSGCRCEACVSASRAYYRTQYWSGYRETANAKRRAKQKAKALST